jgi:pilus assembly protein TadC
MEARRVDPDLVDMVAEAVSAGVDRAESARTVASLIRERGSARRV